jgi:hypothetical protein
MSAKPCENPVKYNKIHPIVITIVRRGADALKYLFFQKTQLLISSNTATMTRKKAMTPITIIYIGEIIKKQLQLSTS